MIMDPSQTLLATLTAAGCQLRVDGDVLRVQDPQQALTDALRAAIRQQKPALLAWLQQDVAAPARPGRVGHHGEPCAVCGDTWQWPTSAGAWVCATCFVVGKKP